MKMQKLEGSGEPAWGVILEQGPLNWQVLQQDTDGTAIILAKGTWRNKESMGLLGIVGGEVEWRVVREETGLPVNKNMQWQLTVDSAPATAATAASATAASAAAASATAASAASSEAAGAWYCEMGPIPAGGPYRLETRFNPKGNKLGEWSLRGDMRHFIGVGDIWIVAGQSNASGYGRDGYQDGPEIGIHMLGQNGEWGMATHPLHDSTDIIFGESREKYNNGHSPFLHFARILKRELGYPIALIPTALGGSPLEAWHPENGVLFANLKKRVELAGGRVKGMIWIQGESDTKPGLAETYLQRFTESVLGWRKGLGNLKLPILTVQLGRTRSADPGKVDRQWAQVREAQRIAAKQISDLTVVPALDLSLDDNIHYSTSGNFVLAERLANCALGKVYGRPIEYLAPELESAVLEQGHVVTLKFSWVQSRLENMDPQAIPFTVEDTGGNVPIDKIVYYQKDFIKVFLKRAIEGQGKISGGYGENPQTLPLDVERRMPILAFHQFEIIP